MGRTSRKRVAIHIVTYNSAATVADCIRSVRAQSYRDWSLLVIDNASGDMTRSIVRKLQTTLVRNRTNIGYAAAHNMAIRRTRSDYVLTLNPDVVLDKHFIKQMVRTLDASPRVGSAAGLLYRVERLRDRPVIVDGEGLYMRKNRRQGLRGEMRLMQDHPKHPVSIFGPDGAAAFYRRVMLEDIAFAQEYFDEDFFMHKEDVDVCWRAKWRGWRSLFVPMAIARHIRTFRPGRRDRVPQELRTMAIRNRYLMMIKNESFSLFVRDIFPILIYELGIFLYIVMKERASIIAYVQAYERVSVMLKKREWIFLRRRVSDVSLGKWFT